MQRENRQGPCIQSKSTDRDGRAERGLPLKEAQKISQVQGDRKVAYQGMQEGGHPQSRCSHCPMLLKSLLNKNYRRPLFETKPLHEVPTGQTKNQNGVTHAKVPCHQAETKLFISASEKSGLER
jgi:hypothetical protein